MRVKGKGKGGGGRGGRARGNGGIMVGSEGAEMRVCRLRGLVGWGCGCWALDGEGCMCGCGGLLLRGDEQKGGSLKRTISWVLSTTTPVLAVS